MASGSLDPDYSIRIEVQVTHKVSRLNFSHDVLLKVLLHLLSFVHTISNKSHGLYANFSGDRLGPHSCNRLA